MIRYKRALDKGGAPEQGYATPVRPAPTPQGESYEHWDVNRLVQIWNAFPKNNEVALDLAADKYDGNRLSFSGSVEDIGSYDMEITVVSDNDRRLSSVDISVSCWYSDAVDRQYLASLNNGDRVKIYGTADVSAETYSFIKDDFRIRLSECLVESVN